MRRISKKGAMVALVALAVGLAAVGIFINSRGGPQQSLVARPAASIGIASPVDRAESAPPRSTKEGTASSGIPGASPGETTSVQDSIIERMIVYNANISLEVRDVQGAMSAIGRIAQGAGGFIVGTSSNYQGQQMLAAMTLRVPSVAYAQVMSELRALGLRVVQENSSAQDVSEQYTDLQSQLRNMEATEVQYLELMKRANTIDEILRVQQRLSEIRGQIERVKGRMNYLERTSEMATITVSLLPEGAAKAGSRPRWDPKGAAQESWAASLEILQTLALAAIRVAVFSWWFLPLLLVTVIWGLQRASRRPSAG